MGASSFSAIASEPLFMSIPPFIVASYLQLLLRVCTAFNLIIMWKPRWRWVPLLPRLPCSHIRLRMGNLHAAQAVAPTTGIARSRQPSSHPKLTHHTHSPHPITLLLSIIHHTMLPYSSLFNQLNNIPITAYSFPTKPIHQTD